MSDQHDIAFEETYTLSWPADGPAEVREIVVGQAGLIFNRYEIVELIGRGGMAEVHRAYSVGAAGFRRPVVIKRILPQLAVDPQFVDMFVAEASTAALLDHPNIVQVFDLGEHGGDLFMVMELVPGTDFGSLVRDYASKDRIVPPELTAYVMVDVCKALECAHGHISEEGELRPVIHRDVSPHNVLLSLRGTVKLGDFGLALPTGNVRRTMPGIIKGKLGYMSPEQAHGVRDLDGRSDLFSLGIVMYEALTGTRLFVERTQADTVLAVRRAEIAPVTDLNPNIPPELVELVTALLEKARDDRPKSASEVRRTLVAYLRTVSPPVDSSRLADEVVRVAGEGPKVTAADEEDDAETLLFETRDRTAPCGADETCPGEPSEVIEIRDLPSRVPLSLPVKVCFGATNYMLQTADISADGFFVVTDRPPAVHSLMGLRLILPPDSAALDVRAMVTHVVTGQDAGERRVPAGMGLQFYDLAERDAAVWERFYESHALGLPVAAATHPPTPLAGRTIDRRRGDEDEAPPSHPSEVARRADATPPPPPPPGAEEQPAQAPAPTPPPGKPTPVPGGRPAPPILFRVSLGDVEDLQRFREETLESGGAVLVGAPPRDQRTLAVVAVVHPETGAELHLPAMTVGASSESCAVRFIGVTNQTRDELDHFADHGEAMLTSPDESKALVLAPGEDLSDLPSGFEDDDSVVREVLPLDEEAV